jgi:Xaa-Pro aminopeptidase
MQGTNTMNEMPRRPLGPQPWEVVRTKLDQALPFANMRDTPYYRDCVWEQFSAKEYARRYSALREKMREHKLDAIVAAGGPSHWSFGAGMLWLTGHCEWHALASYVLVPLDGEPTMIYSMGGTHAEAVRRQVAVAVQDVRHSRNGNYAQVMVERLRELKLERGRIGLMEIDPRHSDYMPVNQYNTLRKELPDAELVFTKNFLHDLVVIHSAEELDCVRKAGKLCQDAMEAMVARARPGAKEYELRAAAGSAILDGGGDIDFLIIGSTPMDNPAQIFGNPRPSSRVLKHGDIINMELAAGYRGYTAQVGSPITLGPPTDSVRKFWEEITLPGYHKIVAEIAPGKPSEAMREASKFFRDNGVQSRPTQCHGIDLVTDSPHVIAEHVGGAEIDMILKPGMVIMAEPNPITADGLFGIFLGHTFIVNDTGHEIVDQFPLEIAVAG